MVVAPRRVCVPLLPTTAARTRMSDAEAPRAPRAASNTEAARRYRARKKAERDAMLHRIARLEAARRALRKQVRRLGSEPVA